MKNIDIIKNYNISWENDGTLTQKDVDTPVRFTGELNHQYLNEKVIGKITAVTGGFVYAEIFEQYYYPLMGKGQSIPSISFETRK